MTDKQSVATASAPLRVAIVGAGMIARVHARVVLAHPGFALAAIVGRSPQGAVELAEYVESELRGERPALFATLDEALARSELGIDLVVITTPSGTHVDIAEIAARAGRHVVIEKPVDVHLQRARRISQIADEVRAAGVTITTVSQNRFSPAVVAVKAAIDSGRFGRVTSATATVAWWRDQAYYDSGDWRGTWQFDGGGALMNQGVHTVDLVLHLLGTPVDVFGYTALLGHERVEVEDVAAAVIRFESGAIATLLSTTNAFPEDATRLQVHGSAGSASVQNNQLEFFHAAGAGAEGPADAAGLPGGQGRQGNQAAAEVGENDVVGAPRQLELFEGHFRQYDDILEALHAQREPSSTVAQARNALALVHSVYVSQVLGTPVKFADVLEGRYDNLVLATGPDIAIAASVALTPVHHPL